MQNRNAFYSNIIDFNSLSKIHYLLILLWQAKLKQIKAPEHTQLMKVGFSFLSGLFHFLIKSNMQFQAFPKGSKRSWMSIVHQPRTEQNSSVSYNTHTHKTTRKFYARFLWIIFLKLNTFHGQKWHYCTQL